MGWRKRYYKEFWALKDASFKIKKGKTAGIIGRNGSHKSTLLQMISGTLVPKGGGDVKVSGRAASLLELGKALTQNSRAKKNI